MYKDYCNNGFVVIKDLFDPSELQNLNLILNNFHTSWKDSNSAFYMDRAVNSAYLTGKEHLDDEQRTKLFKLIGSEKIMNIVHSLFPDRPCFMNTQLFFDPVNKEQNNYWHRDPQYHLSVEEQKLALSGPEVIHFRIPLKDERGIELIPGTHKRWDTDEELNIRLETESRKNNECLESGLAIPLNAGDLLVFSANMIHRGLYGNDRLSLDILFCDPEPDFAKFVEDECLPSHELLNKIDDASAFRNIIDLKSH